MKTQEERRVIQIKLAKHATEIHGGLTQTSKMPCKSYSLPTIACRTGFEMAKVPGSICSSCYANKGFYSMYAATIEPAQHARLESLSDPLWISAIVRSIGADQYFRWHDSGDIQSLEHLEKIVQVCIATPHCKHWLPTREYGIVKQFVQKHGALPENLVIRLSAMFPDVPVVIPKSLQGIPGITASNVHTGAPIGQDCNASKQGGACLNCRTCWDRNIVVSYGLH